MDLFGTGFSETLDGTYNIYGRYGLTTETEYYVTGTLQNGDHVGTTYEDISGTLEFNGVPANSVAAPEPSQFAGLGIAAIGALGLILKARKRDEWSG